MISRRSVVAGGAAATAGAGALGYALWPRATGVAEEAERQRRLAESDPDIPELVRLATLAANGHNSQPWLFRINAQTVSILPDMARRTEVVDPDDHHLFCSLGCATENLVISANANGRRTDVAISGGGDAQVGVTLRSGSVIDNDLYRAIPYRQSTRSVYDGQPVSGADLSKLMTAAAGDGVEVLMFTDPAELETILEFVVAGNSAQMDDPAFLEELEAWLRFSPERALRTNDGLFGACSGNPVVPEWLGRRMFKALFTKSAENDKYRDHIRTSAGIAVFIGPRQDPESWIKVGRSFQRFALQATVLGIRNAHLNMPIEVPSIRPDFARAIGAPGTRPDLVVRFGRAPALPMWLRRPVSEVLI